MAFAPRRKLVYLKACKCIGKTFNTKPETIWKVYHRSIGLSQKNKFLTVFFIVLKYLKGYILLYYKIQRTIVINSRYQVNKITVQFVSYYLATVWDKYYHLAPILEVQFGNSIRLEHGKPCQRQRRCPSPLKSIENLRKILRTFENQKKRVS